MKKLFTILLAVFAIACSKDNNGGNDDFDREAANRELIGTWQRYYDGEPRDPESYIQFNEGYTTRSYYIDWPTDNEKEYADWGSNYLLEKEVIKLDKNNYTYKYKIENGFLYLYPLHIPGGYLVCKKVK